MLFWGLVTPLVFLALLLVLARLEDWVVAPADRAARISRLLESTSPEEVERAVAEFLAPLMPTRVRAVAKEPAPVDDDTRPLRIPLLRQTPRAS